MGARETPADELLTVKESAAILKVSISFIYGLCESGQISHFRFGSPTGQRKSIRINRSEIEAYRAKCQTNSARVVDPSISRRKSTGLYQFDKLKKYGFPMPWELDTPSEATN